MRHSEAMGMNKKLTYVLRTLQGIEPLVESALMEVCSDARVQVGHRTLLVRGVATLPSKVIQMVDDAFVLVQEFTGLDHTRASLERLEAQCSSQALLQVVTFVQEFREEVYAGPCSLTASFLGRRNYTRWELAAALTPVLEECLRVPILDPGAGTLPEHDLHVRLHLEKSGGWLGVRLFQNPCHVRPWKQVHAPGALSAPLAQCMLYLAKPERGAVVVDPACGVGTIPIEASMYAEGVRALGVDISEERCLHARENVPRGSCVTFVQATCVQLPLLSQSVDCLVTDLPWGRQTPLQQVEEELFAPLFVAECMRVMRGGGRLVLLSEAGISEALRECFGLWGITASFTQEIGLFGKRPCLMVVDVPRVEGG